MCKNFKVMTQTKKLLNTWKKGKERKTERMTNKLINVICLHHNLKGPDSNLEFSVPQNIAIQKSWSPAPPFFLPTPVSVLYLKEPHKYAYGYPCSTSK